MAFSKREVVKITGLKPRAVQFYTEQGFTLPRVNGTGRGRIRTYFKSDLIELMIVKELADYGMTVSKIKSINDKIMEDERYNPSKLLKKKAVNALYLLIFINSEGNLIVDFIKGTLTSKGIKKHPSCIIVNYGKIIERVKRI